MFVGHQMSWVFVQENSGEGLLPGLQQAHARTQDAPARCVSASCETRLCVVPRRALGTWGWWCSPQA